MLKVNKINVKKLNEKAQIPKHETKYSAGLDLKACLDEDIYIKPHTSYKITTGISIEIPENMVGLVFARSGIATKNLVAPSNKVGVIDSDYRGEICVFLYNSSDVEFKVSNGDRIAQLVIVPYICTELVEVDELSDTKRSDKGFGSTGIK